jgi:predicted DNA-binding antitoxin AbrB/MazE fold protein
MAKTLKEMRVATPQTRGMAGSRGIMRKKTGPRGANKKEKVYEPTRGQLNNIRRRGEGISSTTKFMDQVRSIAPSVYNHPKVQDIFRNHAETNESVGKTPGDRSYYNLQKAKELAKKAGHDYDKLPQYDRRHNDHKDYFDNKAKNESKLNELSPKTLSNYARGAAMDMGTKNYVRGFEKGQSMMGMKRKEDPKDKKKAQNRLTGIITATDKLRRKTNEDVSKASRAARSSMMKKPNPVNITRAGINKAGRDALKKATTSYDKHNKNDVLAKHGFKRPTSEAVNPHDDEGANHIVMQLRKAVTLRGMRPVEFKDGKKVRVEVGHAQKFLSKYNQAKPADKEKMQAKAQKSHGHFKSTISEELELNEDPSKSLKDKSEKSRIPVGILRSVYNRGMAAWKGGHRKGMAQQQWAHARVNSFIGKGSGTWGKADKDLADKARAAMKSKKNESVNEDRMAGKYRKGQTIIRGQWPNPDKWAEEYIMPNADKKGVRIYSTGPAFVIEKL